MDRPRPVCPLGKQLLAALGPHSEVIKAALLDAVPSFAAWTAAVLCARDQVEPSVPVTGARPYAQGEVSRGTSALRCVLRRTRKMREGVQGEGCARVPANGLGLVAEAGRAWFGWVSVLLLRWLPEQLHHFLFRLLPTDAPPSIEKATEAVVPGSSAALVSSGLVALPHCAGGGGMGARRGVQFSQWRGRGVQRNSMR